MSDNYLFNKYKLMTLVKSDMSLFSVQEAA